MVTEVTNLETVKIVFRHLRFLLILLLLSSTRLAPLREQWRDQNTHAGTVVKFFWQVPCQLSF